MQGRVEVWVNVRSMINAKDGGELLHDADASSGDFHARLVLKLFLHA
jgi:hypothetical protein